MNTSVSMDTVGRVLKKIEQRRRISRDEALMLYSEASLPELGILANLVRKRLHPHPVVTYVIDRNINYTNVCVSGCKFCAYFRAPGLDGGYILNEDEIRKKIEETLSLGGTQILLQGGLHPDLTIEYYERLFQFIKKNFSLHLHALSPSEVVHISQISNLTTEEVLKRLKDAGLDSIPGGGAEILVDRVRKIISPRKASADQWLRVMEEAHNLGMRTTATMMFGHVETMEERIKHLERLRMLQDRTGGFTAFIPWPFQPRNTALSVPESTGDDYLRILAISRIFLDNFENIQASWVTQGPKVAQIALHFGANDFGSTMIEENVVAATGVSHRLSEAEIRRLVKEAGFEPRQRLMDYTLVESGRTGAP